MYNSVVIHPCDTFALTLHIVTLRCLSQDVPEVGLLLARSVYAYAYGTNKHIRLRGALQ
jgi:hypothetical protein